MQADHEITPGQSRFGSRPGLILFLIFALESLFLSGLKLPETESFDAFAFGDSGSNYTAQYLLRRGDSPTTDFAWIYGLLPLEFGRFWTSIAGDSPRGYHLSLILLRLVTVAGMARFLTAMGVTRLGLAFAFVTMPHWLVTSYPNWTHALETALLVIAFGALASKNTGAALALVTASVFVKPSMAYVFGAWILVWIVLDAIKSHKSHLVPFLVKSLAPAAFTGLVLGGYLSYRYGFDSVLKTMLPGIAMKIYQASNFGFFFGVGRNFWGRPGMRPGYYFGSHVGIWIASTLVLLLYSAKTSLGMLKSRQLPENHDRSILTCTVLHIVFICLFFGAETSWFYYSFLLILGVANLGTRGKRWDLIVAVLVCMAVVSLYSFTRSGIERWQRTLPTIATHGLWTTVDEAEAWTNLDRDYRGQKVAFLCGVGDADLMSDLFLRPVCCYLSPGMEETPDALAKAKQIEGADVVIVPFVWEANVMHILEWPLIKKSMAPFEEVSKDKHFLVYRRREGSE